MADSLGVVNAYHELQKAGINIPLDKFARFVVKAFVAKQQRRPAAVRDIIAQAVARGLRLSLSRAWVEATHERLALPGVYALYDSDGLCYVGSAGNIRTRLRNHEVIHNNAIVRIRVRYFKPGTYWHLSHEARLITRLRPRLNKALTVSKKASNA